MTTSTDPQTRAAVSSMAGALVFAASDGGGSFTCQEADDVALGLWLLGEGEAAVSFLQLHSAWDTDETDEHEGIDEDAATERLRELAVRHDTGSEG